MRKTLPLALVAALIGLGLTASAPATASSSPPAVYVIPHQDDETLSMGADVRSHLYNGREVLFYLFTDGSTTAVCDRYIPMSASECTSARDAEFLVAANLLGVERDNIVFVADPATGVRPDDRPGQASADRMLDWIIDDVEARYPGQSQGASWKTMSWGDSHDGHEVMGIALREAYKAGTIDDVRFFLKRENDNLWPDRPSGTTKTLCGGVATGGESYNRVRAASFSYGIGNLSVRKMFENLRADIRSCVHDAVR